jgi:hypothetical protein
LIGIGFFASVRRKLQREIDFVVEFVDSRTPKICGEMTFTCSRKGGRSPPPHFSS